MKYIERLFLIIPAAVAMLLAGVPYAVAQECDPKGIEVSPLSGPPGSTFSVAYAFANVALPPCAGEPDCVNAEEEQVQILWDMGEDDERLLWTLSGQGFTERSLIVPIIAEPGPHTLGFRSSVFPDGDGCSIFEVIARQEEQAEEGFSLQATAYPNTVAAQTGLQSLPETGVALGGIVGVPALMIGVAWFARRFFRNL